MQPERTPEGRDVTPGLYSRRAEHVAKVDLLALEIGVSDVIEEDQVERVGELELILGVEEESFNPPHQLTFGRPGADRIDIIAADVTFSPEVEPLPEGDLGPAGRLDELEQNVEPENLLGQRGMPERELELGLDEINFAPQRAAGGVQ